MRGHHITITADHPQDHHGGRLLAPEDHGDLRSLLTDPPVILSVDWLVHGEELLIREERQVALSSLEGGENLLPLDDPFLLLGHGEEVPDP